MTAFVVKVVCCLMGVIVGISAAASTSKLPKGFMRCKLSDPALNKCIKSGLESAYPYLAKGIPNLGLLPVDPMRIASLGVDQGVGAVKLKLKFKDLEILNLKTSVMEDLKYDQNNYNFRVTLKVKEPIILQGLYEANGKVLVLPITGNGTCKFTLDDYKSFSVIQMRPVARNGNTHLEIVSLTWKFVTSKLHIELDNLFGGDKVLGENMNIFLNENWKDLLTEMQPTFEQALSSAFVSIAQQFFNRVPLEEIFSD